MSEECEVVEIVDVKMQIDKPMLDYISFLSNGIGISLNEYIIYLLKVGIRSEMRAVSFLAKAKDYDGVEEDRKMPDGFLTELLNEEPNTEEPLDGISLLNDEMIKRIKESDDELV